MDHALIAEAAQVIAGDPFARALGIELLDVRPGHSRLAMIVRPDMVNFNGLAHGGAIFTLADAAFAAASNGHGSVAVALSMTVQFLDTPSVGTRLIAGATERRLGRQTGFYEIIVAEESGRPIALCQGVVQRRDERVRKHDPEDGGS